MKRKLISLLPVLILSLGLTVSASAAPSSDFVIDERGYLTDSELAEMNELADSVYEATGVGVFFIYTTAASPEDYDIASLVSDLEDYYIMMENDAKWYSIPGGKAESISPHTEEAMRAIYDQSATFTEGLTNFFLVAEECFAASKSESATWNGELLVLDEAALLTDSEAAALNEKLHSVSNTYNAQVLVVTLPSMNDGDIDGFVEYLYDTMGFGFGENRDGVLLLVCMDPREYRILSNGFAGDAITPSDIEDIGDEIVPDLSGGNYASAFNTFADETASYLDIHLNGVPFNLFKKLIVGLIIGFIIGFIVTLIMKSQLKSVHRQNQANSYVKSGSMNVTLSNDLFLYRNVTRTKKESSSSSSRSRSGGGSRSVGGGSF